VAADTDLVRASLGFHFQDVPGLLSICSDKDGFAGRRFTTDEIGIAAATRYISDLERRQPKGIYAQVTTLREHPPVGPDGKSGRGGKDLAHGLTLLWADGDYGDIGHKPGLDDMPHPVDAAHVQEVVLASGLPEPSGWWHSGGGYNPIWALAEPYVITDDEARAAIEQFTMGLQAVLGASAYSHGCSWDTQIGNLDRLMRVPGTINRKAEPRPTGSFPGSGEAVDLSVMRETVARLEPNARILLEKAAAEKRARQDARLGRTTPAPPPRRAAAFPRSATSGPGVFDILAAGLTFRDVLEPQGWTYRGTAADGRHKWLRPAGAEGQADSEYSLVCDDHVAVNWSERAGLPTGQQSTGKKLTVPTLWAHLHYNGDESEAARDVLRAAAGRQTRGAASRLPAAILAEVQRRCMTDGPRERYDETSPHALDTDDPWDGPQDEPTEEPNETSDDGPTDRLPDAFWNSTPTLAQIRQMAQARRASPDAVLHAVLARTAAMADPTVRVDSGIQQPATIGWYCGLFGPSGSGKGNAENTAEELTPFPMVDLAYIDISTGQGLIAAYLDLDVDPDDDSGKKKVLVQRRTRGYALATEGSVLDAMAQMSAAATLNGVLCKGWMSERQGTSNAEVERRRALPKGSYTLSMSLGVQEEPAAKLLEMGSIGLPQRLAWSHAALGPDTPKQRPPATGPVFVTARNGEDTPVTTWVSTLRNLTITVPEGVTQELDDLSLAISFGRGAQAPLDTHEPLWRVKCAALIALLHGRTAVTGDDWDMATLLWQTSQKVRDRVQEAARRRTQAEVDARRAEAVLTAAESHAAVYEVANGVHPSVVNVAKRAHRYLTRKGEEIPARDVNRNCIKKTDRDKYRASGATDSLWSAALQYGCEQGWLALLDDGGLLTAGSAAPEQS
jgi:hypothetical protein